MLELSAYVVQLYPEKTKAEAKEIFEIVKAKGREYHPEIWAKVKPEDLKDEKVKNNLIYTLWQSQVADEGTMVEIVRSLRAWSYDGSLMFDFLSDEDNDFYQRYYCFGGWLHFADVEGLDKEMLLSTRMLPLACVWNVPVYLNVQQYFVECGFVRGMKEDARLFAIAMELNNTMLGEEGKTQKPINEWLKLFNETPFNSWETHIEDFFTDNLQITRLSPETQEVLHKIITLYYGLRGGFIWREIEDSEPPAGFEKKEKKTGKTTDEYYLEGLYDFNEAQMRSWLEDQQNVIDWIALTNKPPEFLKKLVYVLWEKVNLDDGHMAELLVSFFTGLQGKGLTGIEDVIYFDEQDKKFHWNDEVMLALRPDEVAKVVKGEAVVEEENQEEQPTTPQIPTTKT